MFYMLHRNACFRLRLCCVCAGGMIGEIERRRWPESPIGGICRRVVLTLQFLRGCQGNVGTTLAVKIVLVTASVRE